MTVPVTVLRAEKLSNTGFFDKVARVRGVINSFAL